MLERRAHQRFGAMNRALVVVGDEALPYHIVDISLGGLAFRYIGEERLARKVSELNILYDDKTFLEKVPVESVSDISLREGYIPMRRLGVKYRDLTPDQKSRLQTFIQSYTQGSSL